MKNLGWKLTVASAYVAALALGGFAVNESSFAASSSSPVNVLPSLSNQGDWHVETPVSFYVRAGETPDRVVDTIGAYVREVDTEDADVQIAPINTIQLIDGHVYTLSMLARADDVHPIRIFAQTDGKHPHLVGLNVTANPGYHYESITTTFVAHGVDGSPVRFGIAIGAETGRVWVQDLSMKDEGPAVPAVVPDSAL